MNATLSSGTRSNAGPKLWQHPYVNVFKLCGLDQMHNATKEGEVTTVVDRGIGRKAILINGNVPAANFLRLPKVGASSLGLTGRFLYAQVKLDPERFYVVHIDCLCADSYAQSPVKTTAGARVGRQTVRLSLSNLYKQKKGEKYAHLAGSAVNVVYEPPVRGWSVLVFDIPALLQQAGITDRYDCVKAIQLGAAMAARNVFTSDTLYAEHNMPKEMALSAKPDAVFDIVHVGELPPAVPAPSPPVAPERFQSAFAGDFVDDVDDDVGASPAPVATFALRENNVAPGGEGPCHGAPRRVVLFVCPGLVFFPSARDDRPCVRPDLDASTAGVRFRPFSLGSAIDDMIAAGLTATAAARMRSRSRLTKSKAPAQSKAEKAHHASFAASVEEAKTARVPKSPLKPALDQNRSRSPPRSDSPGRERSRGVSGKSPAKKNIPLTAAAAGKPRNPTMGRTTTNAEGVDTGFFGAGGAGGLVNHRAQVFQGRPEEVYPESGMPLPTHGKTPPPVPAGAKVPPALHLERIIGLSGEHADAVAWAPNGKAAAYPCNNVVIIADVETGAQSHLFGHTENVHLLCFSKDGRVLATGQKGRHPTIRVWDFATRQCIATLYAHASALRSLDISPDGRALAAAGMDTQGRQLIAVWDISQSYVGGPSPSVLRHRTDYHVNCIRFSPFEEDHLVTCGKNSIRTYRLRKGQLRGCSVNLGDLKLSKMVANAKPGTQDFELNDFTTLAFEIGYGITDLDQKHVYVATVTGAVVQVNYGKRCLECVYQLHDGAINALCINEGFAVTASDDRFLRVWPVDFSDFFLEAEHEAAVTSASVSSDGLQIVAATATGSLGTLDIPSHAYRTLLRSHNATVHGCAADPENDEAATVSEDGTIRVWDVATGEQLYEFDAPGESARCCAYRPHPVNAHGTASGQRALACGFTNGLSRVFDVGATSLLAEHRQHKGAVVAVAFTPDGGRMITAGSEGNLCVYDANQGYLPIKYLATALPTNRVAVAVSPDGAVLATIGPNAASVLLFDMDTLQLRTPALRPPGGAATRLGFTPDGKSLLIAGDDHVVARYDVTAPHGSSDGSPMSRLDTDAGGDTACLAVDPSQRLLVASGSDNIIRAWPLAGMRDPALPSLAAVETPTQAFVGHNKAVLEVAFASKGRRMISVGEDNAVFVWGVDRAAAAALEESIPHDHVTFSEGEEEIHVDEDVDEDDESAAFAPRRTLAKTPSKSPSKSPSSKSTAAPKSPAKSSLKSPGKYGRAPARADPEPGTPTRSPAKKAPTAAVKSPLVQRHVSRHAVPLHAWAAPPVEPLMAPPPACDDDDVALAAAAAAAAAGIGAAESADTTIPPTQLRPTRVLGLSSGTAAAAEEETENAAAVAAAAAAPPALFIAELGAVAFAAGADVVVERVGGDRQQALLRRHRAPVTALAHHAETKRIASASAANRPGDQKPGGACVVYVWDASTGACLRELHHADCGGSVSSLAFSPEGALLLSVGADPEGAVRVWDVASGVAVATAATRAPVAAAAWCVHAAAPEFATAGADGAHLWRVTGSSVAETHAGSAISAGVASAKMSFDTLGIAAGEGSAETLPPVCTAVAVGADGALFVGDSRGRVWRSALGTSGGSRGTTSHVEAPPMLSLCCQALPRGEAVTALAAVAGGRVFAGSARRARVWVNDGRGGGWEEVGELELDGAVVSASFGSHDVLGGSVGAPKPSGLVTTTAGSAWLVEVTTGTARALVQAHPLDVMHVASTTVGRRAALATVAGDGTARVWDAASSAKVIEVHADPRATTRAVAVAVAPDGSHVCLGCNDGSVGVVRVTHGGSSTGSGSNPGVHGPVQHVPAHRDGAVICVTFVPPPILAPRGLAGLTPLLSVAADGSIALTQTHRAGDGSGEPVPTELVAAVARGPPHRPHDPVAAAAVERETSPALVAVARAGGLQVYAVDVVEHKSALRSTYTPHADRFMALAPAGATSVRAALVAWSASRTGVVCYCSRATAGKVVVFNAATSTVERVVDHTLSGMSGPRCLAVAYRPGGGDIVAVGGDEGVDFVELPSDSSADEPEDAEDEYLMRASIGTSKVANAGLRRGVLSLPGGAEAMTWSEDGKSAWIASGNSLYMVANPASHLR